MASFTRDYYGIPHSGLNWSDNQWDSIWASFKLYRLTPPQGRALLKFAAEDCLTFERVKALARLSGRGYIPPLTSQSWRELYHVIDAALPGKEEAGNETV